MSEPTEPKDDRRPWTKGLRVHGAAVTPEQRVERPRLLHCAVVTLSHKVFDPGALPADLLEKQRDYAEEIGCEALADEMGILATQSQYAKLATHWEALRMQAEEMPDVSDP